MLSACSFPDLLMVRTVGRIAPVDSVTACISDCTFIVRLRTICTGLMADFGLHTQGSAFATIAAVTRSVHERLHLVRRQSVHRVEDGIATVLLAASQLRERQGYSGRAWPSLAIRATALI